MPPAAKEETASESGHRGHLSPVGVPENLSRFRTQTLFGDTGDTGDAF